MNAVLVSLLVAIGPCDSASAEPAIRSVQGSNAFRQAAHALADTSPQMIQSFCGALELNGQLPGGSTFVVGLAVTGFVPVYAEFAVDGDSVWLLNPIVGGAIRGGLDSLNWNSAVAGKYEITNDSVARYYARGISAIITNWGPAPHPFCGLDWQEVETLPAGGYRVKDWLLLVATSFTRDARLVDTQRLACEQMPSVIRPTTQ